MIEAARREARELDHGWIGVEHLLLAIARGESVASRALERAGAPYAALRDRFADMKFDAEFAPPPRWSDDADATPRLKSILGSVDDAGAEELLVAVLSEPVSLAASLLDEVGSAREEVAGALRELGVVVGELPPEPPWWRVPRSEPVYVPAEQAERVVHRAAREVGVGFAFNWTREGGARLSAPADVDLQGVVDRLLSDA